MQHTLFSDPDEQPAPDDVSVEPAVADPADRELAAALPSHLYLGTSSWNYPGWTGLVWARDYPEAALSRRGLPAYVQHPLFRAVSLDRGFYRPLTVEQFAAYAAQVPDGFRFLVKAPNRVTDAVLRDNTGRGTRSNPHFLDPATARSEFVEPAIQGLGAKLGALVFQISPLPGITSADIPRRLDQLHRLLQSLADLRVSVPQAALAVEVRDPEWLVPAFAPMLRDVRATYCLALHAKMPPIVEQLPILRALWPGPLVCRWNLNAIHGAFGYTAAARAYAGYRTMVDPDPETRGVLARVIAGTTGGGQAAYVSISNKAEGSAPLSVRALAQAVREAASPARGR